MFPCWIDGCDRDPDAGGSSTTEEEESLLPSWSLSETVLIKVNYRHHETSLFLELFTEL
jgi:hypothetical protein